MTPEQWTLVALIASAVASLVMAVAVVVQTLFSKKLTTLQSNLVEAETGTLKLQQALFDFQKQTEDAKTKVKVFATVKHGKLKKALPQQPRTALLYIANLSAVGIWVEKAYVIVNEQVSIPLSNRDHKTIEWLLAPYEVHWATIEDQIRMAVLAGPSPPPATVTVRCEVIYWANGEECSYQMPRAYAVTLNASGMVGVREVE
jgi:hypothetical protein